MRILVTFDFGSKALLSWGYPNYLRGLVFKALQVVSPALASLVHDRGLEWEGKRYKPLTFSLLFPERKRTAQEGLLVFGRAAWFVSSPLPHVIEAIASGLLFLGEAEVGKARAVLSSIEVLESPRFEGEALFSTLSPVVASTGERRGAKFVKKFLSPEAPEFPRALEVNLARKYAALKGALPAGRVEFEPIPPFKSRLFEIEGTKVKCYDLRLRARGAPELLSLAYEAGVGERNAQGFGMLGLLEG